jgi:hypothetical protein
VGGPRRECSEFSRLNFGTFPGEQYILNTVEREAREEEQEGLFKEKQDICKRKGPGGLTSN